MLEASLTPSDAGGGQKKGRRPFGSQAKSASAASELLNILSKYVAVVLPRLHPIWLVTRLTSDFVRVPRQ